MDKKPIDITLFQQAQQRSEPFTYQMHSNNLVGLAVEAIQLAKLVATEERDLEAIRTHHELRMQFLERTHEEILIDVQSRYTERAQIIDAIKEYAKMLVTAGEYGAAQQIMMQLAALLTSESPLATALNLRAKRLEE